MVLANEAYLNFRSIHIPDRTNQSLLHRQLSGRYKTCLHHCRCERLQGKTSDLSQLAAYLPLASGSNLQILLQVAFIVNEQDLKDEMYLDCLNQLLSIGHFPGLFTRSELESIASDLRPILAREQQGTDLRLLHMHGAAAVTLRVSYCSLLPVTTKSEVVKLIRLC